MKKYVLIYPAFSFLVLAFLGCDKDDDFTPIAPQEGTIRARLGEGLTTATKAIYVDLSTGATTEIEAASWDLAFESKGKAILINTSKKARLLNTGLTDLAQVTKTDASTYGADKAYQLEQLDGDMSKTAVGDWTQEDGSSKGMVYVSDLGVDVDHAGAALGHKKWVVVAHTRNASFQIKYANMDGSGEQTKTIRLSSKNNFTYFSFAAAAVVDVAPEKGKWDLVLRPITVQVPDPNTRALVLYSLVVAHSNSYEGIGVAVNDPLSKESKEKRYMASNGTNKGRYDDITQTDYVSPSTKANVMGIDPRQGTVHWWDYDMANRKYHVFAFITYIVKDAEGKYFKLRFNSVTDPETGKNGTPQFEYKELK